jgi:hypothetical protein
MSTEDDNRLLDIYLIYIYIFILSTLIKWDMYGHMVKFLTNFLINRSFWVKIQNRLSNTHYIENGLTQGSALSVSLVATNK